MKRRRILAVIAVVGVVTAILIWPRGPREPVYQGKPLGAWLREVNTPLVWNQEQAGRQRHEAARKAIQAIGTNAVPWLLSEFPRPASKWRLRFNQWAQKHRLITFRFEKNIHSGANLAAAGLYLIGPDAASALPTLANYLGDARLQDHAGRVMSACGEKALPYLVPVVASTNPLIAASAAVGLGHLAREFESALPPLIQALKHRDASPRQTAAHFLGTTGVRPDLAVPELMRALSDPEAGVRREATDGLVRLSKFSHLAVPELVRLKTNANPATALAASNALHRISLAALPHVP